MEKVMKALREKMDKVAQSFKKDLLAIRTGRASTSLLDDIKVEAYGSMMPLNQVGSLNVPEPKLITIQPWDKSIISAIEKSIRASNLGLNPSNDGVIIRVPIPPLNEERRKELVKLIRKSGEEMKVTLRGHRRDSLEELKVMKTKAQITEDDEKRGGKDIQKITDDFTGQIDKQIEVKEKEIMEV